MAGAPVRGDGEDFLAFMRRYSEFHESIGTTGLNEADAHASKSQKTSTQSSSSQNSTQTQIENQTLREALEDGKRSNAAKADVIAQKDAII